MLLPLQVHSRTDILHLLLDSGADVNLLDSCGIASLNACYHVEYAARPEVNHLAVCMCTCPCSNPAAACPLLCLGTVLPLKTSIAKVLQDDISMFLTVHLH